MVGQELYLHFMWLWSHVWTNLTPNQALFNTHLGSQHPMQLLNT